MKVFFLLVFWLPDGTGYISVSGLPSQDACESVYNQLASKTTIHKHRCISYEVE